jgi:hypothetical protein
MEVRKLFSVSEISSSHGGEYEVQNFLLGCTSGMMIRIIPDDEGSTYL